MGLFKYLCFNHYLVIIYLVNHLNWNHAKLTSAYDESYMQRTYFWTYPRYAMTPKRESKHQWLMPYYILMVVLYKYRHNYITNGSLNFRLDSRLGVMAYRGNV